MPRAVVPEALAVILAGYTVEDVSVEDPPLEEVIAEMFSRTEAPPDRALGQVPELLGEKDEG